ncbi:MAG: leucine-rich repeat protein [Lachnospiraceae bacterium]|jgi:hypothetical protein|nr:leucine-rich repeat protein [Lachnospiraceae bacterium]
MKFLWEKCRQKDEEGVRILRVLGGDGQIELPEGVIIDRDGLACGFESHQEGAEILPVLEVGEYAFSAMIRREPERSQELADIPAVCGGEVESVALPGSLVRIGRYGFYNCENLKKLTFFSSIGDLGAGLFTGCQGIEELDVRIVEGEKSCLPEILAELNQMLRLTLRDEEGNITAKLLLPEFFEEAVENTPARILVLETHGCGHRYRYCFRQTQFQFPEYDSLFPYVCVQEPPEIVAELSWYRLQYPEQLTDMAREQYVNYIKEHPAEAIKAFVRVGDMAVLHQVAADSRINKETLSDMTEVAAKTGQTEAVTVLMDAGRMKGRGSAGAQREEQEKSPAPARKRRFQL